MLKTDPNGFATFQSLIMVSGTRRGERSASVLHRTRSTIRTVSKRSHTFGHVIITLNLLNKYVYIGRYVGPKYIYWLFH